MTSGLGNGNIVWDNDILTIAPVLGLLSSGNASSEDCLIKSK
jgi:hypothetical protein